jgi:hypothetical protein
VQIAHGSSVAHCPACAARLAFSPPFLATPAARLLFVAIAVLVGSSCSGVLVALGLPAAGLWRLAAACMLAGLYTLLCRGAYRMAHPPIVIPAQDAQEQDGPDPHPPLTGR